MTRSFFRLMKWKILTGVAAVAALAVILVVRTDRARRIHEHNARLDTRAGKVAAEPWTRIETDSFVIYSDAPQAVLPLARDLEMLHRATESLAVRPAFKSGSTIVVLPSGRSQWRTLAAARPARGPVRRTRSGVGDLIVVDGDWEPGARAGELYRALAATQLRRLGFPPLYWHEHGLGALLAGAQIDRANSIVILKLPEPEIDELFARGWLPWADVLAAKPESALVVQEPARFAAQSAALVYRCLGERPDVWQRVRLPRWLAELHAGQPATPGRLADLFDDTEAELNESLTAEITVRQRRLSASTALRNELTQVHGRRAAQAAEIRELFILSELLGRNDPGARTELAALRAAADRTPSLRPIAAELLLDAGDRDGALMELRAAIAADAASSAVYAAAARWQFERSLPDWKLASRLGPEAAEMAAWCERAQALDADNPEPVVWRALTQAFAPSFTEDEFRELAELYAWHRESVRDDRLSLAMAVGWARQGDPRGKAARPWAKTVLRSTTSDAATRRIAAEILESIPADPDEMTLEEEMAADQASRSPGMGP